MRYSYGITAALLTGGAAISLMTGYPAGAQVAQNDARPMAQIVPRAGAPTSFADLTAQLSPAVVNISTRQRITVPAQTNPFSGTPFEGLFGNQQGGNGGGNGGGGAAPTTREAQSLGSGFLISADGYVVTNNHVINPPDTKAELEEVSVTTADGTEYPAQVVARDQASDLAVLKIKRPQPFPFVHFGDSSHARVGDWVIAIGNPFSLGGTVTAGIISAVYRNTDSGGAYDRYIQTDASINRGNSGGPLFDMQGDVIGINNAIYSPSGGSVGIGFAIPAEVAAPIVNKLVRGEEIVRGYVGVRIQRMNDDLAAALGIPANRGEFIQSVQAGEPAEKAGVRSGDVVLRVGPQEVTREQSLSYLVANLAPGTRVNLDVLRDGKRISIPVTVGRRPSEDELTSQQFNPDAQDQIAPPTQQGTGLIEKSLGVQVIPLTAPIATQLGVAGTVRGLVVAAVDPNSYAGQMGLARGTIITGAGGRDVANQADLEAAIAAAKSQSRAALLLRVIVRGQPAVSVPLRLR
ncbi:MAG: Do family serine endopeptidase [Croceibacterium sp.]